MYLFHNSAVLYAPEFILVYNFICFVIFRVVNRNALILIDYKAAIKVLCF